MIRMVKVNRQSLSFCKYTIALTLWIALFTGFVPLLWAVSIIMGISALTGVDKAPLVKLSDITLCRWIKPTEIYINYYSMRFAHIVAVVFSAVALIFYYLDLRIITIILTAILALLQSIAAFGFCSAQKLYECVICNNNCCNLGNRIRRLKRHDG